MSTDKELREIVLYMYFMEEFEDYNYEELENNFDKTQLPKIEERLKSWRDKSVNEALVKELLYWSRFFEDPTMNAMTPSERLEDRADNLNKKVGK